MGLNDVQKIERSEYLEKNLEITECSQRKPYVFISYASDSWETVFKSAVVPMQKQYGLRVYADKAFDKVNDKWIVPMLRNVRGADAVIAFVSQSYIESYACFLELLTAVNNKKQIVFVSLEEQLHLGNTTDQPTVERGVKNEILNQGGNIATNTNNTSNDLMRAMKSAYTSISTLLEQDALSKYDISDAFINFFRDASINRKTIYDLNAVKSTIKSISSDVFDESLKAETIHKAEPVQQFVPAVDNSSIANDKEEDARKAREAALKADRIETEQRLKAEAEAQIRTEAQQMAKAAAERKAREEAARSDEQEEIRGVKEGAAKIWEREEAELRIKAEAEAKVRVEAEQRAKEEAERKAKKEAAAEANRLKWANFKENIKNNPEYHAKVSMILGILTNALLFLGMTFIMLLFLSLICGIVGIIFAIKGLKSKKKKLSIIALVLNGGFWGLALILGMFG